MSTAIRKNVSPSKDELTKIIDYPINHTRHRTVDDDGPGNRKHFGANTEDEALCLCQLRTYYFVFY